MALADKSPEQILVEAKLSLRQEINQLKDLKQASILSEAHAIWKIQGKDKEIKPGTSDFLFCLSRYGEDKQAMNRVVPMAKHYQDQIDIYTKALDLLR